jgi:hypothetical protein
MVLPGIQALFGFQLIAVFNERFSRLADFHQHLHLGAILLIAVSIALIMTPAAYHRQAEPGTVSPFFVRFASILITVAMIPLMFALCAEVFILVDMILGSTAWGAVLAALLLGLFSFLWFVLPRLLRFRGGRS